MKRGFSEGCAKRSAGSLRAGWPVYRARENREREAMVDEEIKDVSGGPTGAPVNRDARREPDVIEGEIAASEAEDSKSSPYATAAETSADARAAAKATPRPGARSLLAGAVGGLVVSALGLAAGYSLLTSKAH